MTTPSVVQYVHHRFSKANFPGVALGILRGDALEFHGFGFADVEKRAPIDADTLFAIGSMSKSFTALVVLMLAAEGKLSLQDPVSRFIPVPLRARGEDVRVEHLLNHTSGLADPQELLTGFSHLSSKLPKMPPVSDWDGVFAHLVGIEEWSFAAPGQEFHYWNMGYTLLSYIAEKVAGQALPDLVAQRVFEPLGMRRTGYTGSQGLSRENVATAYLLSEGKLVPGPWGSGVCTAGAGGIVSSVNDLSRYLRMFLNRGVSEGRRIVSEAIVAAMQEPSIPAGKTKAAFGTPRYGRGLFSNPDFFGDLMVSHSGGMGNSNSMMQWLPERGCGVVAFCNGSTSLGNIPAFALAVAAGKKPFSHPLWQMERALEHVSGSYESFRGLVRMTVGVSQGLLKVCEEGEHAGTLLEPMSVNDTRLLCRIPNSTFMEMPIEFRFLPDRVELVFERELFKKYERPFVAHP